METCDHFFSVKLILIRVMDKSRDKWSNFLTALTLRISMIRQEFTSSRKVLFLLKKAKSKYLLAKA